jgi:hypothetical protein
MDRQILKYVAYKVTECEYSSKYSIYMRVVTFVIVVVRGVGSDNLVVISEVLFFDNCYISRSWKIYDIKDHSFNLFLVQTSFTAQKTNQRYLTKFFSLC